MHLILWIIYLQVTHLKQKQQILNRSLLFMWEWRGKVCEYIESQVSRPECWRSNYLRQRFMNTGGWLVSDRFCVVVQPHYGTTCWQRMPTPTAPAANHSEKTLSDALSLELMADTENTVQACWRQENGDRGITLKAVGYLKVLLFSVFALLSCWDKGK